MTIMAMITMVDEIWKIKIENHARANLLAFLLSYTYVEQDIFSPQGCVQNGIER